MMMVDIENFIKDTRIMKDMQSLHTRILMVIGSSDTGKTTLIESLADLFAKKGSVGIVDLDMGQSHIGLPSTVAWGRINRAFRNWSDIQIENFYFVGALSPVANLLPTITGSKIITDMASASCDKIIIDTTGLIKEPAGRILKQLKIDLLRPDVVLALERSDELGHILNGFSAQKIPRIYSMPVPDSVNSKSAVQRARYRRECFRSYLGESQIVDVLYEDIGIRFTRAPIRFTKSGLKDKLVSFRSDKNMDTAVGIIRDIRLKDKLFFIQVPKTRAMKFSTLVIGEAVVDI